MMIKRQLKDKTSFSYVFQSDLTEREASSAASKHILNTD